MIRDNHVGSLGIEKPDESYDALIVGARVAGATLASLLGDAGYHVLLVDRDMFPSPTLSTHYFRGGRAVSVLKRLGVLDEVLGLDCPPLEREYRFRNGTTAEVRPAQQTGDVSFCLSVRREPLVPHRPVRGSHRMHGDTARLRTPPRPTHWSTAGPR